MITAATLFSGIGAPEAAMPHWRWAWCAEIEKFPSAVMAAHHPQSINLGDVTAHDFVERAAAIAIPDVLVFGSPCQSYSVAGRRLGLDDPRGNLALVALGIVSRLAPRWIVFENVPGLLSSTEGSDWGIFLQTVDELGYSGAWASLDAQWFGVAQRRERLFFVGHIGDWRGPAAVLFEPASLCGDHPPRRQAGERPAPTIASRPTGGGGLGTDFDCDGGLIAFDARQSDVIQYGDKSGPLDTDGHTIAVAFGGNNTAGPVEVATACNAHGGPHGRLDFESETFVATTLRSRDGAKGVDSDCTDTLVTHSLRADGFVAHALTSHRAGSVTEDGTGRGTPIIPIDMRQVSRGDKFTNNRAPGSSGGAPGVGIGEAGDPSPAIAGSHVPAIAFSSKDHGADSMVDCAPTLRAGTHDKSHANAGVPLDVAYGIGSDAVDRSGEGDGSARQRAGLNLVENCQPSLRARPNNSVAFASAVRRLLPVECESLQGFPRNYTLITYRGKPAADGPRYKALGNSMAVPVVRWILRRIEELTPVLDQLGKPT